jgi:hypothetical protein
MKNNTRHEKIFRKVARVQRPSKMLVVDTNQEWKCWFVDTAEEHYCSVGWPARVQKVEKKVVTKTRY